MSNNRLIKFSDLVKSESKEDNVIPVEVSASSEINLTFSDNIDSPKGMSYIPMIENTETCPLYKLSFRELLDEMSKSFIKALEFNKINSMHSSTLGFFSQTSYVPDNMKKVSYDFCNQFFYVIKNSSREYLVYETIADAVRKCDRDWFSIPLVREEVIKLLVTPVDTFRNITKEEYIDLKIWTLNFTPDEIKYMRFSFIKKVGIQFNENSSDLFKDAEVVFFVNKDALNTYPYRKINL